MPAEVTVNEKNMNNGLVHKVAGASLSNAVSGRSPLQNIAVNYMYRDASNYKCHETVVFANPRCVRVSELWERIIEALRGVMLFEGQPIFKPELVGLPTAFLFDKPGFRKNEDDHDWHELVSVEETGDPTTCMLEQPIEAFIESLSAAHNRLTWK